MKFYLLVKKEIRELLTPQMLVPLFLIVVLFMGVGKVIGKQVQKNNVPQPLAVMDLDKTDLSNQLVSVLESTFKVERVSEADSLLPILKEKKISMGMVIPKGFKAGLLSASPQEVQTYTVLTNFSYTGSRNAGLQKAALAAVNDFSSSFLINQKLSAQNPDLYKNPIKAKSFVSIGDREAEVAPEQVLGFVSQQTTFIPIILFLVIVLASQMVAMAMAQEKENKTLETLLSAPVSRNSIIAAKLVGAGIASLLMAAVYMFGFKNYMSGFMGTIPGAITSVNSAISSLGLVLSPSEYLLLGVSLFFGILAALSVAIILASFVEDVKSVQAVTTPLMVLILIPYLLVMFLDISSLPLIGKYAIYLIPFSHPFLAAQNVFLHKYSTIIFGAAYELVFFGLFVWIAAKLFSSDKLLTLNLNIKKLKRQ